MLGHRQTEETKEKLRKFNIGKKLSLEHRIKIKENNAHYWSGKVGKNKGKKFSEEVKKRMSEGRKRFYQNGGVHPLLGTHRSLETRKKISKKLDYGLSKESHKIRNSIQYGLWRNSVFARDNWICQKTGKRGGKIVAHHIKNFAEYPELRFAIDNGVTLSDKSHKEFHKKYGRNNNTIEQLKDFLNY